MSKWRFSIEQLREAVSYDPISGKLTWLHRPLSHFGSDRYYRSINRRCAGTEAFAQISQYGYAVGCIFQQKIMAHHAAFALMTGRWPQSEIDHINGHRADNRWVNLREVTHAENGRNVSLGSANTSGIMGVRWQAQTKAWVAYIRSGGKARHLGSFRTCEDALAARKKAERELGFHPNHGRQARAA